MISHLLRTYTLFTKPFHIYTTVFKLTAQKKIDSGLLTGMIIAYGLGVKLLYLYSLVVFQESSPRAVEELETRKCIPS